MSRLSVAFRVVLILTTITFFNSFVQAQNSRSKPKPTPKPTPKAAVKPTPKPTPATKITASTAAQTFTLQDQVISQIAALRSDPSSFIKDLEAMKASYKDNLLTLSSGERLTSSEGLAPINEVLGILRAAKPLRTFSVAPGLNKAAADHIDDMVKNDLTGHKGSNGSFPPKRVEKYGTWSLAVKENISYRAQSARDIVLNMLIDDGNPKREHRNNLLSPSLRFIGAGSGVSRSQGQLCVLVFAGEFTERRTAR